MIVVDASIVVEILMRSQVGMRAESRAFDGNGSVHVPHLVDVEVLNVLRKMQATGKLSAARATTAVEDLAEMPMTRYGHEPLREAVWRLRNNLSAYDACYVALAETLNAPLLTTDRRIGKSPGHRIRVEEP